MTLRATITTSIKATLSTSPDIGAAAYRVDETITSQFADGTGAGQAKQLFTDTRTIAASGNEDLDLSGALSNAFGTSIAFTAIKAIRVKAAAANTNDVQISPAATNGWLGPFADASDIISVPPGGQFLMTREDATGWAVTAGTGDLLNVANSSSGTGVTYTIELIGETA